VEKIAGIQLKNLQDRVASRGIQLQLPEDLPAMLCSQCGNRGGARQIRHLVQDLVEGPLAVHLLKVSRKTGKMKGKLENGELQFQ
jgi:ATP-dependent Clp protease ATP-binding subunit ClpA